jgi:hypothetical protein
MWNYCKEYTHRYGKTHACARLIQISDMFQKIFLMVRLHHQHLQCQTNARLPIILLHPIINITLKRKLDLPSGQIVKHHSGIRMR